MIENSWERVVVVNCKLVSFLNKGIIWSGLGIWYLCCKSFIVRILEGVVVIEII